MGCGQGLLAGQGLKLIFGAHKRLAQALTQPGRHRLAEAGGGIEAGPDGRATDRQVPHPRQAGGDGFKADLQLGDPAAHLLAQAQGHRILEVGAADLDHIGKPLGLAIEGVPEGLHGWQQLITEG